jgi:uncharacterized protein (TIGR01777 family)
VKIVVTGSTGLIGTPLVARLRSEGHEVFRLVQREPQRDDEIAWDPEAGTIDLPELEGLDAAVNLAGANVGGHRWTDAYKREIRDSRVLATRTLVKAMTTLNPLPKVLINASAVGYYGSRGDEELTEDSPGGTGFLADVVRTWEAETEPAAAAGIRVVCARSGLVMARKGGAFGRLMPLLRLGVGGPLGSGREWWPWITLEDEVGALEFLLTSSLSGPVNVCSPNPARQGDIARAIARGLHRPAVIPMPELALRIVVGEFAGDVVASQRELPPRLLAAGYSFRYPTLDVAVPWLLRKS